MSDRQSPQARSNVIAAPQITPAEPAPTAWYGSVNGHAQAAVFIAPTPRDKTVRN